MMMMMQLGHSLLRHLAHRQRAGSQFKRLLTKNELSRRRGSTYDNYFLDPKRSMGLDWSRPSVAVHPIDDSNLLIEWPKNETVTLAGIYLRDNCSCSSCRHPETKQRILDTFSIPIDISIERTKFREDGLSIKWANDGHESFYSWNWLRARGKRNHFPHKYNFHETRNPQNPPTIRYEDVMKSDDGVKEWTAIIREWGFCYVDGCPVSAQATQELLERIAFIRHTHYGGFWEFTSDLGKKDSAYTQMALEAHTDTTYFTDPAGLQAFHLLSHQNGNGGASLLVDGFRAAEILRTESPKDFDTLCEIRIHSHASGNDGIHIMPDWAFPVITLQENNSSEPKLLPRLRSVRWNNDDRAALPPMDPQKVTDFYRASKNWVEILRRDEMQYWDHLRPGRPIIFDNWRMLHGRSAFTGNRRMCGGYINMEDFLSRWKTLNFPKKEIMDSI